MKVYAVKVISEATEKNNNFKGETRIDYYGREEKHVYPEFEFDIRRNAYTRKCDANRLANKLNETFNWFEETFGTWIHSLEIVEFEI